MVVVRVTQGSGEELVSREGLLQLGFWYENPRYGGGLWLLRSKA